MTLLSRFKSEASFTTTTKSWFNDPVKHMVKRELPQEACMVRESPRFVGEIKNNGANPNGFWPSISRKTLLVVDAVRESLDKNYEQINLSGHWRKKKLKLAILSWKHIFLWTSTCLCPICRRFVLWWFNPHHHFFYNKIHFRLKWIEKIKDHFYVLVKITFKNPRKIAALRIKLKKREREKVSRKNREKWLN